VILLAELVPGTLRPSSIASLSLVERLKAETERWNRTAVAVNTALRAQEA
jgi:hypothetical protein